MKKLTCVMLGKLNTNDAPFISVVRVTSILDNVY